MKLKYFIVFKGIASVALKNKNLKYEKNAIFKYLKQGTGSEINNQDKTITKGANILEVSEKNKVYVLNTGMLLFSKFCFFYFLYYKFDFSFKIY